jgi:hypothetical protein
MIDLKLNHMLIGIQDFTIIFRTPLIFDININIINSLFVVEKIDILL